MGVTRHYATLDGLRGIAAVVVVISHAGRFFGPYQPGSAYLAVDLFFVLSGFVIAHAYGQKLAGSYLSFRAFVIARVTRLYPLYASGTVIAALAALTALTVTKDAGTWNLPGLEMASLLALFMLPSPIGIPERFFPLNFPAWSLFYEMVVNLAYAAFDGKIRPWLYGSVIAFSAGSIVVQSFMFGGVNQGALWITTPWALARVFYSFPIGIILYHCHRRLSASIVPTALLCAALAACLYYTPPESLRATYDIMFVLFLSPALVLAGAVSAPGGSRINLAYQFLGTISYPLYVLHDPIIAIITGASRRLLPLITAPNTVPWSGIGLVVSLIVASWFAAKADSLVRVWIANVLKRPRSSSASHIYPRITRDR